MGVEVGWSKSCRFLLSSIDGMCQGPSFSKKFSVSHLIVSSEGFSNAPMCPNSLLLECYISQKFHRIFYHPYLCGSPQKSQLHFFFSLLKAVLWITNPTLFLGVLNLFHVIFLGGKKIQLLSLSTLWDSNCRWRASNQHVKIKLDCHRVQGLIQYLYQIWFSAVHITIK